MHERRRRLGGPIVFLCMLLGAGAALPQTVSEEPPTMVPTIEVIGSSPLLGSGIDRDKVPASTRSLSKRDLRRDGSADLTGTLNRQVPGININDVQDNPFQPDVQFRGFDASPVLGTPQGLAIYQNGVRINEAFGDTVNWDLIPDVAINRVNLTGANPVFGLNALGGALAVEMKNGFTFQGGEAELSGGSFGRRGLSLEYGAQSGGLASYVAARGLNENGWRDHSPSQLRQLYTDLGMRNETITANISFTAAANHLTAVGPTPVQLLNGSRSAVYTAPQTTYNNVAFLTAAGGYQATETLSLQSNFYYRSFRQQTLNGNTSDAQPCNPPNGLLCIGEGIIRRVEGEGALEGGIDQAVIGADRPAVARERHAPRTREPSRGRRQPRSRQCRFRRQQRARHHRSEPRRRRRGLHRLPARRLDHPGSNQRDEQLLRALRHRHLQPDA